MRLLPASAPNSILLVTAGSNMASDVTRRWPKAAVVPTLGLLIDIFLAYIQMQPAPAHLSATLFGDYDLLSFQSILNPASEGRLKVTWDTSLPGDSDRPIELKTCRIAWLLLANNGQSPLEGASAIRAPLLVELQGEGQLLLVRQEPEPTGSPKPYCHITIESGRKQFTISTDDFINPREFVWIKIVHSGNENALTLRGRVLGQENIQLVRTTASPDDLEPFVTSQDDRRRSTIWWIVIEGAGTCLLLFIALILKSRREMKETSLLTNVKIAAPLAFCIPIILMVVVFLLLLFVPGNVVWSIALRISYGTAVLFAFIIQQTVSAKTPVVLRMLSDA